MGRAYRQRKASSTQGKTFRTLTEQAPRGASSSLTKEKIIAANKLLEELANASISEGLPSVIKELYPHGHPAFTDMCLAEMELHDRKNKNYAGGGHPLGNFYRVATIQSLYPNLPWGDPAVSVIGMVLKQIDNVLWALNTRRFYVETSIDEHLSDISVYMKILRCIRLDAQPGQLGEKV